MFGRRVFQASHRGAVRLENQDCLISRPELGIYAVADGAGGHDNGRLAAETVIEAIADIAAPLAAQDLLNEARRRLATAHARLADSGNSASTVAVLMLDGRYFLCLWAGDSRIYIWRQGELLQLTRDHSLVQEMIEAGTLKPHQARTHPSSNVITQAVGAGSGDLQLEKRTGEMSPGDRFLLCTDGLNKTLDDDEISQLVGGGGDVAAVMLDNALRRRARDNVSLIVVCHD